LRLEETLHDADTGIRTRYKDFTRYWHSVVGTGIPMLQLVYSNALSEKPVMRRSL